ncbi:MAG: phosphatidate cytidylyltransferase [Naasia sp.]|uniref:phosphatidate cytidylyltransferase n=1 Tax=Naasia sp. TaxID=2546198 RepID=UPI0026297024|nr:phosphatidate cytidylyltransferase [Naasia sp.]MCU1571115.1 phosphatidate cytidylyltransferase [Naasia sp.]
MSAPKPPRRWRAPRNKNDLQAEVAELQAQVRAAREQFDEAQERINARTGRNLLFAVVVGLVLGFAMIFSLIYLKALFLIVAGVLVGFGAAELAGALRYAGRDVPRTASVIASVGALPVAYWIPGAQWPALLGAIAFVSVWRLVEVAVSRNRPDARELLRDLGAGTFIQLYLTLLASCAVVLTAGEDGQWWTMSFLVVVVAIDIGAYGSGLAFGKHQMAPKISPKKTWEGFAGSVVAAILAAVPMSVFLLHLPWYFGILFGLVIVATATMGDLTESLIKRDLGIKDISSLLPGHGGFLDRLDSILPSAAAALALYLVFG